ncbi:hypothetical protein BH09ACT10_BH09ACT10_16630 [soil metagenome]
MHNKKKFTAMAAFVAVAALAMGACGSSEAESEAPAASTGDSSEALATAAANVKAWTSLDAAKFPMPTESFDAGKGKIAVIAGGFVAPVHAEQAKVAATAVKAIGWDLMGPYDGEFSPAVQGGYIDQAVQEKADAVVLVAIDVNSVKSSVDRALKAGVTVTCTMCDSGAAYRAAGVIDVSVDFTQQGEYLGWYLIDKSKGKAKILNTVEPAAPQTVKRAEGLTSVIESNCADCTVESLTIPAADSTQAGPPQWTAFLSANPSGFTDAVAYYDGLSQSMLATVKQTGREDIDINGYDADVAIVEVLRSGDAPFGATVGEPYEFASWGAVDLAARTKAKVALWESTNLPNVLVTKDNAADYEPYLAPQGDWKAEFQSMWSGS